MTNSGGEGNLLADVAADVGLELPRLSEAARRSLTERWPLFRPRNPLDPWGADEYEVIYPEALRVAAAEGGDLVVVGIDQQRTVASTSVSLGLDCRPTWGGGGRSGRKIGERPRLPNVLGQRGLERHDPGGQRRADTQLEPGL